MAFSSTAEATALALALGGAEALRRAVVRTSVCCFGPVTAKNVREGGLAAQPPTQHFLRTLQEKLGGGFRGLVGACRGGACRGAHFIRGSSQTSEKVPILLRAAGGLRTFSNFATFSEEHKLPKTAWFKMCRLLI